MLQIDPVDALIAVWDSMEATDLRPLRGNVASILSQTAQEPFFCYRLCCKAILYLRFS